MKAGYQSIKRFEEEVQQAIPFKDFFQQQLKLSKTRSTEVVLSCHGSKPHTLTDLQDFEEEGEGTPEDQEVEEEAKVEAEEEAKA